MMEYEDVWGKESKQMTSSCPLLLCHLSERCKEMRSEMMTEKCCLSAGKGEKKKKKRRETYGDKAMDSGEEPKDKEKNGVKQKLNEIEGMTAIRSGLAEEETGGNGGREMTSDRGRGGKEGNEEGREGGEGAKGGELRWSLSCRKRSVTVR